MNLSEIYHRAVDIGQAADKFCRQYPHHQFAGKEGNSISLNRAARDIAYQIEHACRSLSPEALKAIATR